MTAQKQKVVINNRKARRNKKSGLGEASVWTKSRLKRKKGSKGARFFLEHRQMNTLVGEALSKVNNSDNKKLMEYAAEHRPAYLRMLYNWKLTKAQKKIAWNNLVKG